MERKAYPVDEKLFDLLLEEDFDRLNTGELQRLFDNSSREISDKWVFVSDKTEREYREESENYQIGFFFSYQGLYGYKYFSLIDYGDDSTYKIGIPDVSEPNDVMDRQKCVTIDNGHKESDHIIRIKKYVFERLASETRINNYLINNKKQILIKSFTDFFHDEFGKIQNQVEQSSPAEDKYPFFVTYNVDLKQFQDYKDAVAKKIHILEEIMDINIKEVFFKPYTNKNIISLIGIELKTMDLVRAINEYIRADASLYLEWGDRVLYNQFYSQMLSQYKQGEANEENIKDVRQIISDKLIDFSEDWYDSALLISSSKRSFYFRSRQRIDKICNSLGNFILFIKNIPKLCWKNLCKCWNIIRLFVGKHEWARIGIGYIVLSIFAGLFQALFTSTTVKTWFHALFQRFFVE